MRRNSLPHGMCAHPGRTPAAPIPMAEQVAPAPPAWPEDLAEMPPLWALGLLHAGTTVLLAALAFALGMWFGG